MNRDEFLACHRIDAEGCWLYPGRIGNRYGRVRFGGRMVSAHRLSYELRVGPIPDSMTVDHLCFKPACINPDHLRLLTPLENSRNQRSAYATHCKNGHAFTAENTRFKTRRPGQGRRDCRRCNADAVARYNARRRAREVAS